MILICVKRIAGGLFHTKSADHDEDLHLHCGNYAALRLGGAALGFTPLTSFYWPPVAAMLVSYATLMHLIKIWFVRRWEM